MTDSIYSRRSFLEKSAGGFGAVALAALLAGEQGKATAHAEKPTTSLTARPQHFPGKAKRVIFLSMHGGPSQVDTFDFKPELQRLHGKTVPDSFRQAAAQASTDVFRNSNNKLLGSPWEFDRVGESGQWVSLLFPHLSQQIDKLCLIKSMTTDSANHAPATYQMNTGVPMEGRPSVGSWVTYGLGSENQNLPGYVLLFDVGAFGGAANWSNGFLPTSFQGTRFRSNGSPVLHLESPTRFRSTREATRKFLGQMNRNHRDRRPGHEVLDGRIASYELAYRMQQEAMQVSKINRETRQTQERYGLFDKRSARFGRMCLFARRLVEEGVRFVQLYHANTKDGWDGHEELELNHQQNAAETDQPVAALLADLEQRGLLEETLVVWAGEFGRTPMLQGKQGRNHNPLGFTVWLAGGGVQGGQAIGATDAIGLQAVQEPYHIKDFHATILASLGLDPDWLSFEHNGRPERLTGPLGTAQVIPGVID